MLKTDRLRLLGLSTCVALVFLGGCGRRTVTVSGTVALPEKITLESDDIVQITFLPEDKEEKNAPIATYSRNEKTFTCKEILPGGKYKIAVHLEPNLAAAEREKRVLAFETVNKTFDRASTKLAFQASEDAAQSIALDFAKGTVTVNKK